MKTAFLFPGQGAQRPGMLRNLPSREACARTLDEARAELGRTELAALDSAQSLRRTASVQLCLLIAGVASARALREEGAAPDYLAGHSVGAFAAAVCGGAISFGDALRLVKLRGDCMERAFPAGYGMAAVSGLSEGEIEAARCGYARPKFPVWETQMRAFCARRTRCGATLRRARQPPFCGATPWRACTSGEPAFFWNSAPGIRYRISAG